MARRCVSDFAHTSNCTPATGAPLLSTTRPRTITPCGTTTSPRSIVAPGAIEDDGPPLIVARPAHSTPIQKCNGGGGQNASENTPASPDGALVASTLCTSPWSSTQRASRSGFHSLPLTRTRPPANGLPASSTQRPRTRASFGSIVAPAAAVRSFSTRVSGVFAPRSAALATGGGELP